MGYTQKVKTANSKNYGAARSLNKILYIVIHGTGNDGDTDESNANYFQRNVVSASAHYFVDDDSVTQSVPDNRAAYSVGGSRYSNYKVTGGAKLYKKVTNANSLNIELCDTKRNGIIMPTNATLENAAAFVRMKMQEYGIPAERVVRHFDVTGKACPSWGCSGASGDAVWKKFKSMLNNSTQITNYSLIFNANYYANKYEDLREAFGKDKDALFNHFITCGMKEARQASAEFNPIVYRLRYKDLDEAFGTNWPKYYEHYVNLGKNENRKAY